MIGWVDASSGASGDMLLGALVDSGVPLRVIQDAVDAVTPEPVELSARRVARAGLASIRCLVSLAPSAVPRSWSDIEQLLRQSSLGPSVRERATEVFERLAVAEAAVHGVAVPEVHFHEVGALDAIADIVGVCAGFEHLGLDELWVSAVAVGSGRVRSEHGSLPVPAPAVVELLRGAPTVSGPGQDELCTPTGAALLAAQAAGFGDQPPMVVERVGTGAGHRDPASHPNVVRLLLGQPSDQDPDVDGVVLIETNVDDLDPRLWPDVFDTLLRTGAIDVWLTPILMKKGRPAHTLSVLAPQSEAEAVRREIFRRTSTLGVRECRPRRQVLDRAVRDVEVEGHRIRVKVASLEGTVVNAQPEYDDVAAVARAIGRPTKRVLAAAAAAAEELYDPTTTPGQVAGRRAAEL